MIHPDTRLQFINDTVGFGIVATTLIPKGTITWVRDPLDIVVEANTFTTAHVLYREKLERYSYQDHDGRWILCWDLGRYMNHSCDPSIIGLGYLCDVAARDVQPGEELTCDYVLLNITESFPCSCGVATCRGTVTPGQGEALADAADRRLESVVPLLRGMPQPLIEVAVPELRDPLTRMYQGEIAAPTAREGLMRARSARRA